MAADARADRAVHGAGHTRVTIRDGRSDFATSAYARAAVEATAKMMVV